MSVVVTAARAAVGAPFRLHGRDPSYGLDCVGLAAQALAAGGFDGPVPEGYALRGGEAGTIAAMIAASGLAIVADTRAGDLMLCASGPGQLHLAIDSGAGFIHADAMLRRVIERPGPVPWPVILRLRLPPIEKD